MNRDCKKYSLFLLCACFVCVVVGCASVPAPLTPYRAHPEFEMRTKNIKRLGLLSPDIKIYEFTAGGLRELRDDWSALGKENIQRALIECFQKKPLEVKPIAGDKEMEEEMEDILALYRAVARSINFYTYGEFKFPQKIKTFDYSVGPIDKILQKYGVDGLILVYGSDEISTDARRRLQAIATVVSGISGVYAVPRSGITVVYAALVDPSGAILWYNIKRREDAYDLRQPYSALRIILSIVTEYPVKTK